MTREEVRELLRKHPLIPKKRPPPEPVPVAEPVVRLATQTELSLEGERDRQRREAERLTDKERQWEAAAKHNRVWLEELGRIGLHHAGMKRAHAEAEYWAKHKAEAIHAYNPFSDEAMYGRKRYND